jgi:hypothetical protein
VPLGLLVRSSDESSAQSGGHAAGWVRAFSSLSPVCAGVFERDRSSRIGFGVAERPKHRWPRPRGCLGIDPVVLQSRRARHRFRPRGLLIPEEAIDGRGRRA